MNLDNKTILLIIVIILLMRKKCSFIENFECPDNHFYNEVKVGESWNCKKYNTTCSFNKDKEVWDVCEDCNKFINERLEDHHYSKILMRNCKKSMIDYYKNQIKKLSE